MHVASSQQCLKKLQEPASSASTCATSEFGNNSIDKDFFDTLDHTASSQVTALPKIRIKILHDLARSCMLL